MPEPTPLSDWPSFKNWQLRRALARSFAAWMRLAARWFIIDAFLLMRKAAAAALKFVRMQLDAAFAIVRMVENS